VLKIEKKAAKRLGKPAVPANLLQLAFCRSLVGSAHTAQAHGVSETLQVRRCARAVFCEHVRVDVRPPPFIQYLLGPSMSSATVPERLHPPPMPLQRFAPPSNEQPGPEYFLTDDSVTALLVLGLVVIPFLATMMIALLQPFWQRFRANALSARIISKPFYRWAFRQGRRFTDDSIDYFTRKYMIKYLRKRQKLGIDKNIEKLVDRELLSIVDTAMTALTKKEPVAEALNTTYVGMPDTLQHALAQFAKGLHEAGRTNIGLSHAKVREYWIYRGPRWLFVTLSLISSVFLVDELIKAPSHKDRTARLVTSTLAMTTACIMLYFRLPDSIRSGVCRSAHDYYVRTKKILTKESRSHCASSLRGEDESSDDGPGDLPNQLGASSRDVKPRGLALWFKAAIRKKRDAAVVTKTPAHSDANV